MHWKLKAAIQNTVSLLPSSVSYWSYFWLQRHFGRLRMIDPTGSLAAGIETWRRLKQQGHDGVGKVFFEVGTGRTGLVPLAFWLMGAKKTVTIDLNPYLHADLVRESVAYIAANRAAVGGLFGSLLHKDRLDALIRLAGGSDFSIAAFLDLCQISYVAPGDATRTSLPDKSVDVHTSYTVFEHVPREVLAGILDEGNRIVADDGLFVHRIDYSDHFSHSDARLSPINFLQFTDAQWQRYAGNRYMYMNRLRHDDYIELFHSADHRVLAIEPEVDLEVKAQLNERRVPLADPFRSKPSDILATTGAWFVSQKRVKAATQP